MESCKDISLRELFSHHMDTGQAVFVKNLPNKASVDNVQCFIEVILKAGVIAMYWPASDSKTCCIAVVDEPVTDFDLCAKLLQKRPLEGNTVGLCALGRAAGLFIRRVPEECTNQFLELYFESPRSSGEEGCVRDIKSCDCCQNRIVVIVLENEPVVKRILERPSHPSLDKYNVHIMDPYFPLLHDLLLKDHPKDESMVAQELSLEENITTSSTVSDISSFSTQAGNAKSKSPTVTCVETSDLLNVATQQSQVRRSSGHGIKSESSTHQQPQYSKQGQAQNQHCEVLKQMKQEDAQTKLVQCRRQSSTKLRIFCEEPEKFETHNNVNNETVHENLHSGSSASFPLESELEADNRDEHAHYYEPFPEPLEHKHSGLRNISTDPPPVVSHEDCDLLETTNRTMTVSTHQEDNAPHTRDNKFRGNLKKNKNKNLTRKRIPQEERQSRLENVCAGPQENTTGKGDSATLEVSKTNIVLLKINGFTKKCGKCKVTLLEKEGRIQFDGDDDSVKQAKIKMYETLNAVEEKTKTLPKHHIAYISESYGYIRSQLTKKKIGVVINTNTDRCTLHSLAFSAEQAERGLEFITKELVSKSINIRDGQLECFQGTEWDNMLQSLQKYVQVTILEDEKSIDIVAFDVESVSKARQKIISYLKESVPKTKTEVELKGASARCFGHCFLEDLKRKIRSQNGELVYKKEDNDTLKVVVTGDDSLAKMIREKVKQIWHEKVDFKKITTDVNELWLLMKGLSTQRAKEFLEKFERDHICFIELTKDGVVSLPVVTTTRLETESVDKPPLPSPPEKRRADYDTVSNSAQPPYSVTQDSHSVKPYRSSVSQEIATEYQLGLTEDEALLWALQASTSDTDLPYRGGISRSYTTGDIEEVGVEPLTGDEDLYPEFRRSDFQPPVKLPYTAVSRPVRSPYFEPFPQKAVKMITKAQSRQFGQTAVTVKQGSIATEQVSFGESVAKVNIVSPSMDLEKESIISKAFVKAGGIQLIQMYEMAKQQSSSGVVVTQGCGSLSCDHVLHISLTKRPRDPKTVIAPVMQECFQLSSVSGCQHIMFPPLGVGRLYQYPAAEVAKCMLNEILRQAQQRNALTMVTLVIYEKDEDTYETFESALLQASLRDLQEYTSSDRDGNKTETSLQRIKRLAAEKRRQSFPNTAVATTNLLSNRLSNAIVDESGQMPVPAPRQRFLVKPMRIPPRSERLQAVERSESPSDAHTRPQLLRQPDSKRPLYRRDQPERSSFSQAYPISPYRRRHDSSSDRNDESEKFGIRTEKSVRTRDAEQPRWVSQKKAKERTPEEPAIKYVLKVFAQDRTSCERARNELGKQLKGQFLYEKVLERRGKISADCKMKIRDTVRKWNVKSLPVPNSKNYLLKGEEKSVTEAYAEILKILLDEGKESEKSFGNRKARRRDLHKKLDEFAKHMAFEHDPEIPSYWKNFKPGSPIKAVFTMFKTVMSTKDFIKVKLETQDPVYKAIVSLINSTWDSSIVGQGKDARGLESLQYTSIQVTKIQRVENLQLFDKYVHRRKHVFVSMTKRHKPCCTPIRKLPGSTGFARTEELQKCHVFDEELCHEVNEHFFFHGTTGETVDAICDTGLDCRLGSHQAMYGAGVYGAESPTKADQYADAKDKRTKDGKKMFLIRMVLGESFLCTDTNPHKYRRPPCANTQCLKDDCKEKSHGSFDSVIGQSGRLFREFVVYQPEQCYPEYVIYYDRV